MDSACSLRRAFSISTLTPLLTASSTEPCFAAGRASHASNTLSMHCFTATFFSSLLPSREEFAYPASRAALVALPYSAKSSAKRPRFCLGLDRMTDFFAAVVFLALSVEVSVGVGRGIPPCLPQRHPCQPQLWQLVAWQNPHFCACCAFPRSPLP